RCTGLSTVTLGGRGLIADQDSMVVLGTYNDNNNGAKPIPVPPYNTNPGEGLWRLDDSSGTGSPGSGGPVELIPGLREPLLDETRVLFSIGSGNSLNGRDAFLVNYRGVTWTRRYYTCSFGADVAELYQLDSTVTD